MDREPTSLRRLRASSRVGPSRSIGSPAYACAIDVVNRMALIPSNAAWWQLRISRSPPSSRTSIARKGGLADRSGDNDCNRSRAGPAGPSTTSSAKKSASSSICQVRVRVPRVGARSRARESGCAAIASLIARVSLSASRRPATRTSKCTDITASLARLTNASSSEVTLSSCTRTEWQVGQECDADRVNFPAIRPPAGAYALAGCRSARKSMAWPVPAGR